MFRLGFGSRSSCRLAFNIGSPFAWNTLMNSGRPYGSATLGLSEKKPHTDSTDNLLSIGENTVSYLGIPRWFSTLPWLEISKSLVKFGLRFWGPRLVWNPEKILFGKNSISEAFTKIYANLSSTYFHKKNRSLEEMTSIIIQDGSMTPEFIEWLISSNILNVILFGFCWTINIFARFFFNISKV